MIFFVIVNKKGNVCEWMKIRCWAAVIDDISNGEDEDLDKEALWRCNLSVSNSL